jgi:hypothetical protein
MKEKDMAIFNHPIENLDREIAAAIDRLGYGGDGGANYGIHGFLCYVNRYERDNHEMREVVEITVNTPEWAVATFCSVVRFFDHPAVVAMADDPPYPLYIHRGSEDRVSLIVYSADDVVAAIALFVREALTEEVTTQQLSADAKQLKAEQLKTAPRTRLI